MKTTPLPAVVLVTVLSLVSARADEPVLKGDLAKLQGKWTARVGPEQDMLLVMTIKGTAATFKVIPTSGEFTVSVSLNLLGPNPGADILKIVEHSTFAGSGVFTLDETAKPHKTIDWMKFTVPDGRAFQNGPLGIYEFVGDDLKMCTGEIGNERPSEFKDGTDGPPGLVLFKHEADKAAAGDDKPLKGDLAQLQGSWTAKVGPEKNVPLTVTFKGNAVTLKFTGRDGEEHEMKGEIKLDEAAKPHKTLDWVSFTRPNGEAAPENLALYELDGKTLTICSGGPGNARPTGLKAGEGGPPNLIVLKKVEE